MDKTLQKKSVHKIGLYIRVSTEEQAENPEGSIRNQEERLRSAIQYKNSEGHFGEIANIFIDRARSGKDTNRPELQRLLGAIRRREISLVMVSELSRLSRSIRDFSEIWELMQANGCAFSSLRENFDTTTAAGEMVLYTVANIAQFERRQISERVVANLNARATRGLYNGGRVPLGYQTVPDKPGYLAVDSSQADIVRKAFDVFLRAGSLNAAVGWLNSNGYHFKKMSEGGGNQPRKGCFSANNLYRMLRSKAYIGKRECQHRGEIRVVRAVWEPIVDESVFEKVQEVLTKNYGRYKPESFNRYPFTLSRLAFCGTCGESLCGKSAHGNGGKIPYYEHSWMTKQAGWKIQVAFDCFPYRVLAKKIEPLVWEQVQKLLQSPELARDVIDEARALHAIGSRSKEVSRLKDKIQAAQSQIEALTERLAQLPRTVSAKHIFAQMERLEATKTEVEEKLHEIQRGEHQHQELPAELSSYDAFLNGVRRFASDLNSQDVQARIIQLLVSKIEVKSDSFRLHYYVGRDYIETEVKTHEGLAAILPFSGKNRGGQEKETFLSAIGSNTLTIGVTNGA